MKFNQWFRKNQKWIYVILGVVIMITWYMADAISDLVSGTLDRRGEIFGRQVSTAEIRTVARNFQAWAPQQFSTEEGALSAAWEHLILLEDARAMGLNASDGEIEQVLGFRFWGPQGIDTQAYRSHLHQYNIARRDFEEFIRELLITSKLQQLVLRSVKVSDDEAWHWFIHEEEQVKVKYAELPAQRLTRLVSVSEDEMRRFHEERMNVFAEDDPHGAGYKVPEKVRLEYLIAPFDEFAEDVVLTEQQIRSYYEENREAFVLTERRIPAEGESELPEERRYMDIEDVRSIIESELRKKAAEELAEEEIKRLDRRISRETDTPFGSTEVKHVDFAPLAADFRVKHAVTEFFDENSIPAQLRGAEGLVQAAFNQGFSDIKLPRMPLKSREGMFIFQLLEIQPPRASAFEEAMDKVAADLRYAKARDLAGELVESALQEVKDMEDRDAAFDAAVQSVEKRLAAIASEVGVEITAPVVEGEESDDKPQYAFVNVGESRFFRRPTRFNDRMIHFATGLPYNRALFAEKAFEIEESLGAIFEEQDASAGYLIKVIDRRFPEMLEFQEYRDEAIRTVAQNKGMEAFRIWQERLFERANPSEPVRRLLARRIATAGGGI